MKKALLLGSLAALASTAPVEAQNESKFFDGYCVMGSFQVCASVRVYSEGNTLRMRVWNLEGIIGGTHTMTAIGLYHSGSPWSGEVEGYSVTHDGTDITDYWSPQDAQQIDNLAGVELELKEGTSGNSGIVGCVDPGGSGTRWATCQSFDEQPYVEFTFELDSHFALADVDLRWHSQQVGPDGELSLKCDTGGAGDYPPCVPMEVVPEPITSLLLGTGLAGVGAAARRRRRKNALEAGADA